jgi:hypothetical protein
MQPVRYSMFELAHERINDSLNSRYEKSVRHSYYYPRISLVRPSIRAKNADGLRAHSD